MPGFVLLDAGEPAELGASFDDNGAWIDATEIETALGWSLRPEGLCREDICIPVANHPGLVDHEAINLEALAELLGRPLALSVEHEAAYMGLPFAAFDETVRNLEAPDFTLPDLDGKLHSLSDHRGSKVLLAAWASW